MEIIDRPQRDLPNATLVLVLGILSLVFCWCYGFIGLILSIIALVLAGPQRQEYLRNPDLYTETSYKNLNAGRICSIVAVCLSSFVLLILILIILGVFAMNALSLGAGL